MVATESTAASTRRYLFLQGPIGLFFSELAARLLGDGHAAFRINLNGGDRLFWRLPGAVDYRGEARQWPAFLGDYLARAQITDVVLFGDCRPLHVEAIRVAAERGVAVHVFEEGYLRPDWITLERGGVNGNSPLPKGPEAYLEAARAITRTEPVQAIRYSFLRRALEDVAYHTAMVATQRRYAGYRTHRPWHPYVAYLHGAGPYIRRPMARRYADRIARSLAAQPRPYFVFALQLDSDTQVRHHSDFRRMQPAVECVIRSFARHAPPDASLIVTEHPLDPGVAKLKKVARQVATSAGVGGRMIYLEGGTPEGLLARCRGMVTVNSTIGLRALGDGVPVIALGHALYALPGLTFQGSLDRFWNEGTHADATLLAAFQRVLIARSQVNGGFYSASAIATAVEYSARRLAQPLAAIRNAQERPASAERAARPLRSTFG